MPSDAPALQWKIDSSIARDAPIAKTRNRLHIMARTNRRMPKILVVDDDPGLLRLLTIRLRSQKYEVEPAENAATSFAQRGLI